MLEIRGLNLNDFWQMVNIFINVIFALYQAFNPPLVPVSRAALTSKIKSILLVNAASFQRFFNRILLYPNLESLIAL